MPTRALSLALIAALCLLSPAVEAGEGQGRVARFYAKVVNAFRSVVPRTAQSTSVVKSTSSEPRRMAIVAGAAACGHAGLIYIPAPQRTPVKTVTATKKVRVKHEVPPPALLPGGAPFGFAGNIFVTR